MKKSLLLLVALCLSLQVTAPRVQATSTDDCGNWDDVPEEDMEVVMAICEYGFMRGYNEDLWGYGKPMLRSEFAQVANRMSLGTDLYTAVLDGLSWEEAYSSVKDTFTDMPNPYENDDYEWMVQAIYVADYNDLMKGDGDLQPTTFRPYDSLNIVESFKVLYQAAKRGGLLGSAFEDQHIDYDADPWWLALMSFMEESGVIQSLNTSEENFWIYGDKTYSDFNSLMDREDVALFLYAMIQEGFIDEGDLEDQFVE